MSEKTFRKNGKWVKVSGRRGAWAVAKGWEGDFKAVQTFSYPTKDGALIAARYWLED